MALIHWLPLNQSLDDNAGSHSITLTGEEKGRAGKTCPYSLYFNGNSFLKSSCSFKDGQDISICFGIKLDLSQPGGGQVFTIGNSVSWPGQYLSLNWSPDYTQLSFSVSDGTNFTQNAIGIKNLNDDKGHHVTAIYSDKKLSLFLDGVLNSFYLISFTPTFSKSSVFSLGGGISGERAKVCINDFRIYDEALSDKEIKKLAQGLILHYNPDHAIQSSCGTGSYNFGGAGGVSGLTQSTVSDLSLPLGEYTKLTGTATGSGGGPLLINVGPSIDGATYTTSFYGKSKGYKPNIQIENYASQKTYTTLAPNGGWYTQDVGKYNASATYCGITFYANPANGTACELDVSSVKVESGDFATPYRRDNKSYIPDSSGFCHDGTIVSEAIEKSTDHRYKKNIIADSNWEHHIQSNINPSFLTSGVTFNVGHKNITKKDFLLANGQEHDFFLMAMSNTNKWSSNVDGEQIYYIDGNPSAGADGHPKDGQGHMYTFVCHGISKGTELYGSRHAGGDGNQWTYNGPLGDIRLYATALSAADVKNLYNETRVTHPMQFLISNSSALASLTSSNPVLTDGELVVVRSTDAAGKTYFNIRKGNGVNNFNSLPGKQVSEAILKGGRSSFVSDAGSLAADKNSYSNLKQNT